MNREHRRQFIHLSGFVFVLAAQILGGLIISIYCFMIAFFFFLYSYYIRYEKRKLNLIMKRLDQLENKFRDFTLGVARTDEIETKFFSGPFWIFLGFGITFILFPLLIASAGCAIVAIGDVFSNFIGRKYGKRKITKNRTVEGSLSFLISSFLAALIFVNPLIGIVGAVSGMLAEIYGKPNDNLIVPIVSAICMLAVAMVLGINMESVIGFCGV